MRPTTSRLRQTCLHLALTLPLSWGTALPSRADTLAQAMESAWAHHPQALSAQARHAQAQAQFEAATRLTPGPAAVSVANVNDRLNRDNGKQEWELELSVPLWLPGQQAARQTEAQHARTTLAAQQQAVRLQLAGDVRAAWWALANARNAHELAQHRLATAQALHADVQRRYQAGELSRIDANLAQSEQLASAAELADADTARRLAEQTYTTLTGSPPPATLDAEAAAPLPANAPATGTAGNTPPSDALHPQLAAAQAAAHLAQARLAVVDHTQRDAPTLATRWIRNRSDHAARPVNTVGFKLSIPLSSGPRVQQDHAAARAELAQADAELALAQRRVALDVARAQMDLAAAQRQIDTSRQRHQLAADNLALTEKAFALGEADLPTLLRVRAAALDAQAQLQRHQVAHNASQSSLNQAMGALP